MKIILLVTVILLASLVLSLDFSLLAGVLQNIKISFLALALLSLAVEISLKPLRLQILTNTLVKTSYKTAVVVTLVGFPFAAITPGRLGDFVKIITLSQKTSLPLAKSFAVGIFEKLLELFSLTLLVFLSVAFLLAKQTALTPLLPLLAFIGLGSIAVPFLLHKHTMQTILKYTYFKFLPSKYQESQKASFEDFYSALSAIFHNVPRLLSAIMLAFLLWVNRIVQVMLLALALSIEIHLSYFLFIIPITFIAEIIPLTIMGLGVREYTYIFLLSLAGITKETSVAISLLVFLFGILSLSLIGYGVVLKEYGGLRSIKERIPF